MAYSKEQLIALGGLRERCAEPISKIMCLGCGETASTAADWESHGDQCPVCHESRRKYSCGRCDGSFDEPGLGGEHPCRSVAIYDKSKRIIFEEEMRLREADETRRRTEAEARERREREARERHEREDRARREEAERTRREHEEHDRRAREELERHNREEQARRDAERSKGSRKLFGISIVLVSFGLLVGYLLWGGHKGETSSIKGRSIDNMSASTNEQIASLAKQRADEAKRKAGAEALIARAAAPPSPEVRTQAQTPQQIEANTVLERVDRLAETYFTHGNRELAMELWSRHYSSAVDRENMMRFFVNKSKSSWSDEARAFYALLIQRINTGQIWQGEGQRAASDQARRENEERLAAERKRQEIEKRTQSIGSPPSQTNSGQSVAVDTLLERATNCSVVGGCTSVMLDAASPRRPDALQAAALRLSEYDKQPRGDRKTARELNRKALEEFKTNNFIGAVELLQQASATDPADVEIQSNLGFIALRANRENVAVEALNRALLLNPRRSATWASLAEIFAIHGNSEGALRSLLLVYEFSSSKEKTMLFFEEKSNTSDPIEIRQIYASVIRKIKSLPLEN